MFISITDYHKIKGTLGICLLNNENKKGEIAEKYYNESVGKKKVKHTTSLVCRRWKGVLILRKTRIDPFHNRKN